MSYATATMFATLAVLQPASGVYVEQHQPQWEPPAFQRESAAVGDVENIRVDAINFGSAQYPLRQSLTMSVQLQTPSSFIASIVDFQWMLVGVGATRKDALDSLVQKVHIAFQQLFGLRPFEMTEKERALWSLLERAVDIDAYKAIAPIQLREVGRIAKQRGHQGWQIEWVDGRKEWVRLDQMPAEMAGFRIGQWIDTVVARERVTGRLKRIVHAEITSPIRPIRGEELKRTVADLPTIDLPAPEPLWPRKPKNHDTSASE